MTIGGKKLGRRHHEAMKPGIIHSQSRTPSSFQSKMFKREKRSEFT